MVELRHVGHDEELVRTLAPHLQDHDSGVTSLTGCVIAAPSDTKTEYTGEEIVERVSGVTSLLYVVVLFGLLAATAT